MKTSYDLQFKSYDLRLTINYFSLSEAEGNH